MKTQFPKLREHEFSCQNFTNPLTNVGVECQLSSFAFHFGWGGNFVFLKTAYKLLLHSDINSFFIRNENVGRGNDKTTSL